MAQVLTTNLLLVVRRERTGSRVPMETTRNIRASIGQVVRTRHLVPYLCLNYINSTSFMFSREDEENIEGVCGDDNLLLVVAKNSMNSTGVQIPLTMDAGIKLNEEAAREHQVRMNRDIC